MRWDRALTGDRSLQEREGGRERHTRGSEERERERERKMREREDIPDRGRRLV